MIVLCPLEFERRALRAAARSHGFQVECTGAGDGAARWLQERVTGTDNSQRTVVLAGLAAGLVAHAAPTTVWQAGAVVDASATDDTSLNGTSVLRPTFHIADAPTATLACVAHVLHTAADKRRVAADTGATLADMESAAFARAAQQRGIRWAVLRAISDGVDDVLPPQMAAWTDRHGRTRVGAVTMDLLRAPQLLPQVVRTGRTSGAAMRALARTLARACEGAYNTHP